MSSRRVQLKPNYDGRVFESQEEHSHQVIRGARAMDANINNVSLITSYKDLVDLEREWTNAWQQHSAANIFLHYGWIKAYVDSFNLSDSLYIVVVRQQESIVAILPTYLGECDVLRVIGDSRSDYCDMVCSEAHRNIAWSAITKFLMNRRDWIALDLREVPGQGNLYQAINAQPQPMLQQEREMSACPSIDLTLDPESHKKMLNKKSMRRVVNVLARSGELKYEALTDWSEIEALMPEFFEQHKARWTGVNEISIYNDKEQRDFVLAYTKNLAEAGCLRFSVLRCGEDIAAIHLGFLSAGRFIWYKPTYSQKFSEHSPGKVILRYLLEDMMEAGSTCFDFTRGTEKYKLSLSNQMGQNYGVRLWRNRRNMLRFYAWYGSKRKFRAAMRRLFDRHSRS